MNGNPTNLKAMVKTPDNLQADQPYFQAKLNGVKNGYSDDQAGQQSYNSVNYQSIGRKYAKTQAPLLERIIFQIECVANKETHTIEMAQELRRYFGQVGKLSIVKNGVSDYAEYELIQIGRFLDEFATKTDNPENYKILYQFVLKVASDADAPTILISPITSVTGTLTMEFAGVDQPSSTNPLNGVVSISENSQNAVFSVCDVRYVLTSSFNAFLTGSGLVTSINGESGSLTFNAGPGITFNQNGHNFSITGSTSSTTGSYNGNFTGTFSGTALGNFSGTFFGDGSKLLGTGGTIPGAVSLTASNTNDQALCTQIPLGQHFTSIANPSNSGNCFLTLPASASLGDLYIVSTQLTFGAAPFIYPPVGGRIGYGGTVNSFYEAQTAGHVGFISVGQNNWSVIFRTPGYVDNFGSFSDYTNGYTFLGQLSFQGTLQLTQQFAQTANPGGGQTNATVLQSINNGINTVANDGDSVKFNSPTAEFRNVNNNGSHVLAIYPHAGAKINDLGTDKPLYLWPGQCATGFSVYDGISTYIWTLSTTQMSGVTNAGMGNTPMSFSMPSALPGLERQFSVVDAGGIKIFASGTNIIRGISTAGSALSSSAGGYATSTVAGAHIHFSCPTSRNLGC